MQQSAPVNDVYACSTKSCLRGLTRINRHDYRGQILGTFYDWAAASRCLPLSRLQIVSHLRMCTETLTWCTVAVVT